MPCASVCAGGSAGGAPPLSLSDTPSRGISCARFDLVQALELPMGDGIYTSFVIRQGYTTLVTQIHLSAGQPFLLVSERSITFMIREFKSWQDMWSDLALEWPRTTLAGFSKLGSGNVV